MLGRMTVQRAIEPSTHELLELSGEERLQAVMKAAQAHAATLAA